MNVRLFDQRNIVSLQVVSNNSFFHQFETISKISYILTFGVASTDVMIVGCLAENWDEDETEEKNMVKVGTCLKCLEQVKGE